MFRWPGSLWPLSETKPVLGEGKEEGYIDNEHLAYERTLAWVAASRQA